MAIQLLSAMATRENQVQLTFSEAPYLSNRLDLGDASDPTHFIITPVSGGVGLDGAPILPVLPMQVIAGDSSTQLRVWMDRAMSHFPCKYTIAVANVVAVSGNTLDPNASNVTFNATRWFFVPPSAQAHLKKDLANPQSFSGVIGTTAQSANLGTYVVDSSGDYSFDEGLTSLRKRIYRRLVTKPGGFAHLPGYGIGLPYAIKRLATASQRARIIAEAQRQIQSEPEVLKCKVKFAELVPGLFRMTVLVRTVSGLDARFDFDTSGTIGIPTT